MWYRISPAPPKPYAQGVYRMRAGVKHEILHTARGFYLTVPMRISPGASLSEGREAQLTLRTGHRIGDWTSPDLVRIQSSPTPLFYPVYNGRNFLSPILITPKTCISAIKM